MFNPKIFRVILIVFLVDSFFSFCAGLDLSAPAKTVIFEDDFETTHPRKPLARWNGISPAWQVADSPRMGLLQADTRPVTRQILYGPGRNWKDYTLTCLIRVTRWGAQTKNFAWSGRQYRRVYWSVALRVKDAANGYRLEYAPWVPEDGGQKQSYYRLVKYTDGKREELARILSRFHSELDYMVRFESRGPNLRAKVWPAATPEPKEWTISAIDSDHSAGTVSLLTANAAVLYGELRVEDTRGRVLLEEEFNGDSLEGHWEVLSGNWRITPWGKTLVRSAHPGSKLLSPDEELFVPAQFSARVEFGRKGSFWLALHRESSDILYRLNLTPQGAVLYDSRGGKIGEEKFQLKSGVEYTLAFIFRKKQLELKLEPFPYHGGETVGVSFRLPEQLRAFRLGLDPQSEQVSLDQVEIEATVSMEKALKAYLRYICDWYMSLELPSGYPKTGTGSPELFIASYCARTLMAGARILDEPVYLEEALRWADFVTTSPSVLVPLVTGTGKEALALRTFPDWSYCVNMADIGSVLLAVGVISPWGDSGRQARYLEVMEKYSLYVIEGCLEDPLILGRGNQPRGWRMTAGDDRGGFGNGYWWMDKRDEVWDVSTTNVGLQFYSILYRLTGNETYRTYATEATDWYLRKEVDTGRIFEAYHDVIYGGEALITAWEHSADEELKKRIEQALGKICNWVVAHQNPDGTWNQEETPRNNRTNLLWRILDWYGRRHPENKEIQQALFRTISYHLDRDNSRFTGVCEVLRKSCFTGVSVAELLRPGITIKLRTR